MDARLTKVIQADLLSTEAAGEFALAFDEQRAQRQDSSRLSADRSAIRIQELDAQVLRLIDAISAGGHSTAMLSRLKACETELEALKLATTAAEAPARRPDVDAAKIFREMLIRLDVELARDSRAARNVIADLVGQITLELRGPAV